MPCNKTGFAELGSVEQHRDCFHAHVQHRNGVDKTIHIWGRSRETEHRAKEDLDQIHVAGAVGETRQEGLKIMTAEARRIQISAKDEAEIQETVLRRSFMEGLLWRFRGVCVCEVFPSTSIQK